MKSQDPKDGRLEVCTNPEDLLDYYHRNESGETILTSESQCLPKTRKLSISRADFTAKLSRFAIVTLFVFLFMLDLIRPTSCLSCYVCGGSTGRSCGDISPRRKSPYIRPSPVLTSDGEKQWEECNDLINNKGCIKQVVNDVVLLRACWMQGNNQCLVDGTATVCTCKEDLCNASKGLHSPTIILIFIVAALVVCVT